MNDVAAPSEAAGSEETHWSPAERRLFSPGPKRILTLDGGGVRGIVSIAFLEEMEKQLRQTTGQKSLVLSDVFDLIAGTSVGSMLATMLALGKPVSKIKAAFDDLAPKIFKGRETIFGQKRFDARALEEGVKRHVGEETLGSPKLVTGLAIIAKRADTHAVWVMTNNPKMPYYHDGKLFTGNKRYKLWSLIRASTAAPFLFTPMPLTIHTDEFGTPTVGTFIDGGVSPHNNPSLLMLQLAGLPAYNLGWDLSPDQLLIISIGTGFNRTPINRKQKVLGWLPRLLMPRVSRDIEEAAYAVKTLRSMTGDTGLFALKMMQSLSAPRFSWIINSEIGDLDGQLLLTRIRVGDTEAKPHGILRFQRYDLPLESGCVQPQYDIGAALEERVALHAIDDPTIMPRLYALATEAARKQVSMADFAGFI